MLTPMLAQILIMVSVTYLWLYLNGNEYTAITGGWVATAWSVSPSTVTATAPGLSKQPTYMICTLSGINQPARSGVVNAANAIDLSAVSKIRVTLSASLAPRYSSAVGFQRIYLIAASAMSGNWPSTTPSAAGVIAMVHEHYYQTTTETLTDVVYELDVSGLPDGSYYVDAGFVWAYQSANSTVRIKSVEMLAA